MKHNNKTSGTLAALTGAALALPAIAQLAQAAELPTKSELGYRYTDYHEDDVDSNQVLLGSNQRYEIGTHQLRLVAPVGERFSLTVDALYESMTGASARAVVDNGQGESVLVMTGASIKDTRTDMSAELRHYGNGGSEALVLGFSREDDYESINGSIDAERTSVDGVTTWSGGVGFSHDELEPVPEAGINRTVAEKRSFLNAYVARARVHSPVWQTQLGLYLGWYDGYLSDPYRSRDIRPDSRQQWAFSGRSRYFLKAVNAAVHVDYRYYQDDWDIASHTLELAWYQSFTDAFTVSPRVRYYSQSQAEFYVPTDRGTRSGDQSSDFRLSPYGAIAYGLGIGYYQPAFGVNLYFEHYNSDGDYALKSVAEPSPFLVDYRLLTLGVDYRF
ncbi:MAG: hypothetical protein CMK83_23360 [Pseudomonadales bacterium]|jgi:hypothetical protein|nr:hypothetical protein [Pseudomonadales bacterium]MCK5789572.1 DUF3570 domain-containing protein [Ketobacter sp.]MEC8813652.1 DUF3570 domain-containing protein [Pseudomonadota bacterium]TNC89601.1 MAG: hypothetical protein CSH49_06595 [Alcanivorax sp.]HAG96141.1 hypothetical protein [Gammaproteobacteria bacterium]|tara:strand:+ start:57965 stop:59128 length:1164 start_codon:yes stop_codon:yes gene_type:complete